KKIGRTWPATTPTEIATPPKHSAIRPLPPRSRSTRMLQARELGDALLPLGRYKAHDTDRRSFVSRKPLGQPPRLAQGVNPAASSCAANSRTMMLRRQMLVHVELDLLL